VKIIGHRGAAGLAPENTIASIKKALEHDVDAIEIDVRQTKDGQLVLLHDADLARTVGETILLKDLALEELKKYTTFEGEPIPTLEEAIAAVGKTPLIIELKESNCVNELLRITDAHPHKDLRVASFNFEELHLVKSKRPDLKLYFCEHTKPFEIIHHARLAGAYGLDLNGWLLNPLTYFLAKRHNLEIFVYTVNNRLLAWWFRILYPGIGICTNYPNRFKHHKTKS
jgi:glycerophosphoryl diester phosphodiesterase